MHHQRTRLDERLADLRIRDRLEAAERERLARRLRPPPTGARVRAASWLVSLAARIDPDAPARAPGGEIRRI